MLEVGSAFRVPTFRNYTLVNPQVGSPWDLGMRHQLGSPGKKSHLNVAPAERCREYYMGEGGGFPRVRAVVSLVCQSARGLSQHPRVSRM